MASVRMGEMSVGSGPGDELVAIGLGSCIGLALVDRVARVAGLAHVVLPESQGAAGPPGKFADLAVPELIRQLQQAGARKERLEAVLVGGARMFALGAGLDIGSRNEAAVRDALNSERLPIRGAETGGNSGRTIKVAPAEGIVNVHQAGGKPVELLGPQARRSSLLRPTVAFGAAGA